jgi:zinc protease
VQSVLDVGRHWVGRKDPRYFATLVGNHVLGADFMSRLNQNLRARNGYTYGVMSVFDYRRQGSVFVVNTPVRADATSPALKELLGELDGLTGPRPLTAEEIDVARDAVARSFPETFENPSGIAGLLEDMAEYDLPDDYLATFLDRVEATKADEIRRVMAEVADPTRRTILVVGDRGEVEPKLKAAGFREIRLISPDGEPSKAK